MKHFTKIFLTLLISIICVFIPEHLFAAEIFISAPNTVKQDETFEVLISLDTDGFLINSVDLSLKYDKDLISFSGYKNDGTVLNLWVEPPTLKNGVLHMSGIIPGGVSTLYDSVDNNANQVPLVTLIFTAKKTGLASFLFQKTEILKNDGKGTSLPHTQKGYEVSIQNSPVDLNEEKVILNDQEKPEPFEIIFHESSSLADTPPVISFQANDKLSGIKGYEIDEGDGNWKEINSPYPVSKTLLSRTLNIRAYDFYGNFQTASVVIPGLVPAPYLVVIGVLSLIFCIWVYKMLKYRYAKVV